MTVLMSGMITDGTKQGATTGRMATASLITGLAIAFGISITITSGPAFAQDSAKEKSKEAEKAHPMGGPGLKIDAGYRRLFSDRKDNVYYNIVFLGETIATQGKAFTDAEGFNENAKFRSDDPSIRLNLERGTPKIDGPLANYLQVTPLGRVRNMSIRATVQGYGTFENTSSLGFAAGVEVPVPIAVKGIPNFLTIGLQAGTQPKTTGTGSSAQTTQSDIGVAAYRQFAAFAPLNQYSDFRQAVHDFTNALPDKVPISLLDFYTHIVKGEEAALDMLATNDNAKAALKKLSADDKKILVRDLSNSATFSVADTTGVSPEVGQKIIDILGSEPVTDTPELIKAFRNRLGAAAAVEPKIPGWTMDKMKAIAVVERFILNGGLLSLNDKNADQAKRYVIDTMKFAPSDTVVATVNPILDTAFKQPIPANRTAFLSIANRLLLESIIPEIAQFGISAGNYKQALNTLYVLKDRSQYVFLLENTGQYYFAGDDGNGAKSRLNHLFAATGTYYFDAGAKQRRFLRARFENGRNRAAPTIYLNQLTATVGLEF